MSIGMGVRTAAMVFAGLAALLALAFFLDQLADGSGLWSRLAAEIQIAQRDLHRQLAGAMRAVATEGAVAGSGLVVLSFLYGVFHAAGPGHGKVVISTYLLTQESQLRRGLVLSLVAALTQGVAAVLIVEATVGLVGLTLRQAEAAASNFEAMSFGLVALVGALLIATRARRLHARRKPSLAVAEPLAAQHGHHDHHDHHQGHVDHEHHAHGAHIHDDACSHCGHVHGPTRAEIEVPLSLHTLAGLVLSVGVRPCSGAVIVLLAAHAMGLRWAGIGAVLAMSLGTGLAVCLLATLSVYARKASLRLAALLPDRATRIATAIDVVGVIGGAIILAAGLLLLQAAWTMPAHPLL